MRVGGAYTFLDYTGLRLGNGQAEVGVATSHMEVGVATSHMEVGVASSHMEVGVATSHMEVGVATSHMEVGVASSHMEAGVTTSHMEVVCATYILPCPHRSCTIAGWGSTGQCDLHPQQLMGPAHVLYVLLHFPTELKEKADGNLCKWVKYS